MKRDEHIQAAEQIGADSWELLHFKQLPKNASAIRQVEALKADQKWIQQHVDEISASINRIIYEIEQS